MTETTLSASKLQSVRLASGVRSLRIAVTGFVSAQVGSVASANALLLQALLDLGMEVDFFSKPSFVDPRPLVGDRTGFNYVPVINHVSDGIRRRTGGVPVLNSLAERNDAAWYNWLLMGRIRAKSGVRKHDAVLWLGDYGHGSVPGVPTISFAQGPPGTDARSILRRRAEIRRLAGYRAALKWEALARLRLSRIGLPALKHSDHIIVGSSVSRERLISTYKVAGNRISTLPYPVDLELFNPVEAGASPTQSVPSALRLLWLGRIIPRKRLDLFLEGSESAIRDGLDLRISLVGDVGFIKGYEQLIVNFAYPERLQWIRSISRDKVPALIQSHDVLAQPSEEENFGSSVAEAQACGLPVIVGRTNGNADYLSSRDIHLQDDRPETFAAALREIAAGVARERGRDREISRGFAVETFNLQRVTGQLHDTLRDVVAAAGIR